MTQIIRVTTIDGEKKDFKVRDAIMAYSYYNSRQSRPAPDGTVEITEWKLYDLKYTVDGVDFDEEDAAVQYRNERIEEIRQSLDTKFPIKVTESESAEQPIEFPTPDWIANPDKNVVEKSSSEEQAELDEAHKAKLEKNAEIDGNPSARSFTSTSPKNP